MTLKTLRASQNLTQKQAGAIFDVSADTWANWEKGRTSPDVKIAYKIAEYFKMSIDDIIFLDNIAV